MSEKAGSSSARRTVHRFVTTHIYLVASSFVFILMVGATLNRKWSNLDFWVWLGPVREFAAHPLNPSHPLIASNLPDSYLGPYTFALGIVTRLTNLDPVTVMMLAGLTNFLLIAKGIHSLTRGFSNAPMAPLLTLIFTLVAWGWQSWRWSGYMSLSSLGFVLPLGSTFAFGMALISLALFIDWQTSGRRTPLFFSAIAFATTALTHQVTGLWSGLILLGIALSSLPTATRKWLLELGLFATIILIGFLIWPFYSIFEFLFRTSEFDEINSGVLRRVPARTFLAIPGLIIIVRRFTRNRWDPLALGFLPVFIVFIFSWMTHAGSLARVLPGVMLLAHITMADYFSSSLKTPFIYRDRWGLQRRLILAAVIIVGIAGTATGWLRSIPRSLAPSSIESSLELESLVEPNLTFRDFLKSSDVVATESAAIPIGGSAAKVVSVGIPQPFIEDIDQRRIDTETLLDPATDSRERAQLVSAYGVTHLVVESSSARLLAEAIAPAIEIGEVNGFVIFQLHPQT